MEPFGVGGLRARLGRGLQQQRVNAGFSQPELARRLEWSQSRISRVEAGRQSITVPHVDEWCRATDATDVRRTELLTLAEKILLGPDSWDEVAGEFGLHRETAEMEAKAGLLSVYQPAILPGLLQTATYARRVISAGPNGAPVDLADRVLGRVERQRILSDDGKRLRFVVPETVLRWPIGPDDSSAIIEHVEQLHRIGDVMARPNVDLRILPMLPRPVWRTGGFVLFEEVSGDDSFVHLELLTKPVNLDEPLHVDLYRKVFHNLAEAALAGDNARTLLAGVIEDMRRR
jgi:transcriptional regulator with XRE-family HTH domain